MARSRIPFEETKVPAMRSQADIKAQLYAVGFTSMAEITQRDGGTVIVAEIRDGEMAARFEFRVDVKVILGMLPKNNKARSRAQRIAWSLIYFQVKALCDSVKLGVLSLPEAFAGHALLKDQGGLVCRLGDWLTEGLISGKLSTESIVSQFLIENKGGGR